MSDIALWNAFREGSKPAFAEIYQAHSAVLYQVGLMITSDKGLISDTLQDMFVRLWRRRLQIGSTDHIRRYLRVVFKRDLIKRVRKKGLIVFVEDLPESIDNNQNNPDLLDGQLKKLSHAMKDLSPKQKRIIRLKYFECQDYRSICSMMNIKYQSARNLHAEAIKRLQGTFLESQKQYKF